MKILFSVFLFCTILTTTVFSQCYELYFENEYGSPHYGYLTIYRNGSAALTVKFPNGNGGWACVYQTGTTVRYGNVSGAEFYNPVICGSTIRNRNYSADNIYWWYDAYGNLYLYNYDDRTVISGAWIKLVACQ